MSPNNQDKPQSNVTPVDSPSNDVGTPENAPVAPSAATSQPSAAANAAENEEKNYLIALVLSYLFGSLGIDRFYLSKIGTGVLKLITLGGFGIWAFIDLLLIAFGKLKAKHDSRPLEGYAKNRGWVKMVVLVLLAVQIIAFVILIIFVVGAMRAASDTLQDVQTRVNNTHSKVEQTQTQIETQIKRSRQNNFNPQSQQGL